MSTENILIFIVLPALGWMLIRIGKISELTALCARCELHLKIPKRSSDTDRLFR